MIYILKIQVNQQQLGVRHKIHACKAWTSDQLFRSGSKILVCSSEIVLVSYDQVKKDEVNKPSF